jgi:hypothetical protein
VDCWESPAIPDRVGERGFALGWDLDWELEGVAVELGVVRGLLLNLPVIASVEMFKDVDGDWLRFLVGQLDLEGFVEVVAILVDMEVGLAARAFDVEGAAGGDFDRVLRGRVVD